MSLRIRAIPVLCMLHGCSTDQNVTPQSRPGSAPGSASVLTEEDRARFEGYVALVQAWLPDELIKSLAELDEKEALREASPYGMSIRNHFALWGNSDMAAFFRAKGIHHPDDMSSLLVSAARRRLLAGRIDVGTCRELMETARGWSAPATTLPGRSK